MTKNAIFLFLILCTTGFGKSVSADEHQVPNIVVMLADDAGWGDFSCVGNQTVSTPAVDSLARDGALLEQFFVQPVCAPTRAEFFESSLPSMMVHKSGIMCFLLFSEASISS